jgi:hypothetical protein
MKLFNLFGILGKNVRWSTDLVQEQVFSSKPSSGTVLPPAPSNLASGSAFTHSFTKGLYNF